MKRFLPFLYLPLIATAANLEVIDETNFLYTSNILPKLHTKVINTTDSPQSVKIAKERIEMPEGWNVTFCFKECLPPFIDEKVFTMNPGDTVSLDVDFMIDKEATATGTAITNITITSESDPSESYVRSYGVTFGKDISGSDLGFSVKTPSIVSPLNVLTEQKVKVFNHSDKDREVTITRTEYNVPSDWNVTMCFDLCLPPFLKSADWNIPANGEKELKVDVEPQSEGTAVLQFDIAEKDGDPVSSLMLSYPTSGMATAIGNFTSSATPVSLTRNGTDYALTLPQSGTVKIELFNMKGQKLQTLFNDYVQAGSAISLGTKQFGAGMQIMKITQNGTVHSFPVQTRK